MFESFFKSATRGSEEVGGHVMIEFYDIIFKNPLIPEYHLVISSLGFMKIPVNDEHF